MYLYGVCILEGTAYTAAVQSRRTPIAIRNLPGALRNYCRRYNGGAVQDRLETIGVNDHVFSFSYPCSQRQEKEKMLFTRFFYLANNIINFRFLYFLGKNYLQLDFFLL